MNRVREKLRIAEQKRKLFKQQQGIFITALERSREQAQERTRPVFSVSQVQWYMEEHCSNSTDSRIFSLFLEIMEDLGAALDLLEARDPTPPRDGGILEACRTLLHPNTNISSLRAPFPNEEVNRLSCVDARSFYGGVVSLIPVAMELLQDALNSSTALLRDSASTDTPKSQPPESSPLQPADSSADDGSSQNGSGSNQFRKPPLREMGGWFAGKPAWRPPGRPRV
ncbi:sperm acrosome-associated protein 9 [Megalops cyprinoides]|uniref:sperm acrosome-associated protein 9 n=1 Tax=Megalops cyprinoides TaxID=118141 RepID=UPI001864CD6E|nr:sperm acrosome-associated protein 9 [Megalops cyprinoides]